MSRNRWIVMLIAAAFLLLASVAGASRITSAEAPVSPQAEVVGLHSPVSDSYGGLDWYDRHRNEFIKADFSDYFDRHPELLSPNNSIDTSDYFLRHPELIGH